MTFYVAQGLPAGIAELLLNYRRGAGAASGLRAVLSARRFAHQIIEISSQDVISRDIISVDAVLYFDVVSPDGVTIQVQHLFLATNVLAQSTLLAVSD